MSTTAPDTKKVTEPLRYDLSDHEIAEIARSLNVATQDRERSKQAFDSLKAEYKARDAAHEITINSHLRKINDGFEMRETACEITFNDPERGRKTVRRLDNGETVRVEAMTALDVEQRNLPIEIQTADGGTVQKFPVEEEADPFQRSANLTPDGERTGTLSMTPGAENAGETSVGAALADAAVNSDQPLVPLNLAQFGSDYEMALVHFRKAAKKAGWNQAAVTLINEQCEDIVGKHWADKSDPSEAVFAILKAHVCAEGGAE